MEGFRSLLIILCGILECIFIMATISSITKAIIYRDKKEDLIVNIIDALRHITGYLLMGSITLIAQNEIEVFPIIITVYAIINIASIIVVECIKKKNNKSEA